MQSNLTKICEQIHKLTEESLRDNPIDIFGLFITLAGFIAADACRSEQDCAEAERLAFRLFKHALTSRFSSEGESLH